MAPSFATAAPQMSTIGDLARELDISTRTIRYYEERGAAPAPAYD